MELVGNEKKIQALFRELKLADQRVAPEFIGVWNRAHATRPGSSRVLKISLAVAMAVLVITLSALVLRSRTWQRTNQPNPGVSAGLTTPGSAPAPPPVMSGSTQPVVTQPTNCAKPTRWDRKVVARRHAGLSAGNSEIQEAISISSWQSPTAMLMQSPADDVLTALPQLDRSVIELKTYFSNAPQ